MSNATQLSNSPLGVWPCFLKNEAIDHYCTKQKPLKEAETLLVITKSWRGSCNSRRFECIYVRREQRDDFACLSVYLKTSKPTLEPWDPYWHPVSTLLPCRESLPSASIAYILIFSVFSPTNHME